MKRRSFYRRFRLFRVWCRSLGRPRIFLGILIFAVAAWSHVAVAIHFATNQPDDGRLYVQLARNLIEQSVFSGDAQSPFQPTLIRLPGYPVFLASVYELTGIGNDAAVRTAQGILYTVTCVFIALIAFGMTSERKQKCRAGFFAFVFSAFCPAMAIYSATLLPETLTMFFLSASVLAAVYALSARSAKSSKIWWFFAGLLSGISVLVRPDAGLFAFGIGLTLSVSVFWGKEKVSGRIIDRFFKGIVFVAAFTLPLVPWTVRNERQFGIFQPLAPAHAEMPGEFVPHGYYLWLRTWIDDSKFIGPMLWDFESKPIKLEDIPASAFASDDEHSRIAGLIAQYNNSDPDHPLEPPKRPDEAAPNETDKSSGDPGSDETADNEAGNNDSETMVETEWNLKITPDVDAAFDQIAHERIGREPWRFYIGLPAKRGAAMWFDTHSDYYPFAGELFPLKDLDENNYQHIWLPLFAGLTVLYTVLAIVGICTLLIGGRRTWIWLFLILFISVPRIIYFGTLENPEPRYLVELFVPASILAGLVLAQLRFRRDRGSVGIELKVWK